jgi:predicted NUDIX family phosphoesterase
MSECLVVSRSKLEGIPFWKNFIKVNSDLCSALFLEEDEVSELLSFINKEKEFKERKGINGVEENPEWQQIIFYALIVKDNKFFVYQRGGENSGMSENRLFSKLSVGVGGHIEPFDNTLIDSLYRELDEELYFTKNGQVINTSGKLRVIGVIKDERDAVGKVHLGLACIVEIEDSMINVSIKSDENVDGWFITIDEYKKLVSSGKYVPEGWTQLVIDKLLPKAL